MYIYIQMYIFIYNYIYIYIHIYIYIYIYIYIIDQNCVWVGSTCRSGRVGSVGTVRVESSQVEFSFVWVGSGQQ